MSNQYQQLMLADSASLTDDQQSFVNLHNQIVYSNNMAGAFAVQLARAIKEMKDGKVYEAAGFESFGDYTETALNIKERQAYNYIRMIDTYSEEFLHLNAKMGITKLTLLAGVNEEQRAELIDSGAAEDTVKELTDKIKELESENADVCDQIQFLTDENDTLTREVNEIAAKTADKAKAELVAERKKYEALAAEKAKLIADKDKLAAEKQKIEKTVKELQDRPIEVATVENPETQAALESASRELAETQAKLDQVNKKLEIASDQNMTRFKIKFEDLQQILDGMFEVVDQMTEEQRAKCVSALKSVLEGFGL